MQMTRIWSFHRSIIVHLFKGSIQLEGSPVGRGEISGQEAVAERKGNRVIMLLPYLTKEELEPETVEDDG